jgi:hypothetical protein
MNGLNLKPPTTIRFLWKDDRAALQTWADNGMPFTQ